MPKNNSTTSTSLAVFGFIVVLLAWRIVVTNMSEMQLQSDDKGATALALHWDDTNAQALYLEGLQQTKADPAQAMTHLLAAIRENPTDGLAYVAIALLEEKSGKVNEATQAMQAATQLAPRRVDVQMEAARFWFRRGEIERAMKHVNVALTFGDSLRGELFPNLLKLAESPATREAAFTTLLKQPITWWPQFFNYVATNAKNVETLRALIQMQAGGPNVATTGGHRAYIQRLQRENLWVESYLAWLNHLRKDQLNAIGNLFNGGFEEEISNLGFDWIVTPASQVVIDTVATYGATGHKALRVVFRGPRIQFQNLHQYVMLDPGTYTLHGRVRPDNFEAAEGLQWSIYCIGSAQALANSERFSGTDHWRHFSLQFQIPRENCAAQMLRLELTGRSTLDFAAKGGIWFDDLSIARQTSD